MAGEKKKKERDIKRIILPLQAFYMLSYPPIHDCNFCRIVYTNYKNVLISFLLMQRKISKKMTKFCSYRSELPFACAQDRPCEYAFVFCIFTGVYNILQVYVGLCFAGVGDKTNHKFFNSRRIQIKGMRVRIKLNVHNKPIWCPDQPDNNLLPNKSISLKRKSDTYLLFQGKAVMRYNGH